MKLLQKLFLALLVLGALVPAIVVYAQSAGDDIGKQLYAAGGANGAGLPDPIDPRFTVALIIRTVMGLLGTIIFGFYIYAGFLWTTAGGNDEQIAQAKNVLKNATIGLVLVLMSYSLTLAANDIAHGYPLGSSSGTLGFLRGIFGF